MTNKLLNHTGAPLRSTYTFTDKRDIEVAHKTISLLKDKYVYGGDVSRDDLKNPPAGEKRIILFREAIGLSNAEAVHANLIPSDLEKNRKLLVPDQTLEKKYSLPFVGAFLPKNQLEVATKLSVHELSPATKTPLPPRIKNIQKFCKALKNTSPVCVLEGWTAIDYEGADYAARDLLSKGANVLIKYGRSSLGQDQWTFYDDASYKKAMEQVEQTMKKKNTTWQESGLVFERKLATHDQFVVGQLSFMGQLISWIGRMDHGSVINASGEVQKIYTGSSKIFVLGPLDNLSKLPLPPEAQEDLNKVKEFEKIMKQQVNGGVITRIQYNLLRGKIESRSSENIQREFVSGITEVTLRGGGGSGAEARVLRALASEKSSLFKKVPKKDKDQITYYKGIPMVVGATCLEYYSTDAEYKNRISLSSDTEYLYDGPDFNYGYVRIFTHVHKADSVIKDGESLSKFFYPTIMAKVSSKLC